VVAKYVNMRRTICLKEFGKKLKAGFGYNRPRR